MKKSTLFVVVGLFGGLMFASCKKDYTCTCTLSAVDTNLVFQSTINNSSKKMADAECDGSEAAYQRMASLLLGSANCTLEKE